MLSLSEARLNTINVHRHDLFYGFLKLGWNVTPNVIDAILEEYSSVILNRNQRRYIAVIFGDLIQRPVEKLIAITTNGEVPQYIYNPSKLTNRKILTVFDKLVAVGCLTHLPHDSLSGQRRSARYQINPEFHAALVAAAQPLHENIQSFDSGSSHSFIRFRHPIRRDESNSNKRLFIDPPYPVRREIKKKNEMLRRYNNEMYHWNVHLPDETSVIPSPCYSNFIGNRTAITGRIQGGFLNKFNSEQRSSLIISDEDTVYLDFQGFNTRALYALNGLQYDGDPYQIDNRSREKVKALATVILNNDNELSAKWAAIKNYKDNYPDDEDYTFDEVGEILQSFKAKHADVAGCFFQPSYGAKLMALEAEVAFKVVDVFVSQNKAVLPIHDGFVVKVSDGALLAETMKQAYISVFNSHLPFITSE